MFSKTVSTLQNKAREQKYKNRLESMEKRTMVMLFATGGGVMLILFLSMTIMMGI
jgi:helix-turn-helix protein